MCIGPRTRRLGDVIQIEHLHKRYGDLVAVEDVTFTVRPNEVFGIIGVNGAGKTTTVECLTGVRTADAGRIEVLGFDPATQRDAIRARVGVQLQAAALPDRLTVREALDLYGSFYPDPRDTGELIELLGLTHRADARYGKLSGGEQQRVSVGLALIGQPQIAVLDELTTGLDPHARRDVWALIERLKADGLTVVLVSHFMDEVERLCDRVAVIHRGRVIALDAPHHLAEHGRLEDAFVELTTA